MAYQKPEHYAANLLANVLVRIPRLHLKEQLTGISSFAMTSMRQEGIYHNSRSCLSSRFASNELQQYLALCLGRRTSPYKEVFLRNRQH